MAIQETKIDSSIATLELFPESCPYNVYRKDRNRHGGGVMLLVHKDISHMPIMELETTRSQFGLKCLQTKLLITWQVGIYILYSFSIQLPNIQSVIWLPNFHVVNLGIQYHPFYPNNHIPCSFL